MPTRESLKLLRNIYTGQVIQAGRCFIYSYSDEYQYAESIIGFYPSVYKLRVAPFLTLVVDELDVWSDKDGMAIDYYHLPAGWILY